MNYDLLTKFLLDASPDIYRYLRKRVGYHDAQDLFSEIEILAYEKISKLTYDEYNEFRYWLYNVAQKKCFEWFRERNRNLHVLFIHSSTMTDRDINPEEDYLLFEKYSAVWCFCMGLDVIDKQIVVFRYLDDMSFRNISILTRVNINTLLTRHKRLKTKICEYLKLNCLL